MKKFILFFLLAFCVHASDAQAQQYKSLFGENSTAWIFQWWNIWPSPQRDSLYVQKDTTVNGLSYKKLMLKYGQYTGGLLREDVNTGKVYYRDAAYVIGNNPIDTVESLLFDYSLETGDTFQTMIVDSVKLVGELKYIYLNKVEDNEPYTMIEGIGSNWGILWNRGTGGMLVQYLLCSYKDGYKTAYNNIEYSGNCTPPTAIKDIAAGARDKVGIYPNPALNSIHIVNETGTELISLQITGIDGRIYRNVQPKDLVSNSIAVNDLPKGIYTVRLFFKDFTINRPLAIQ